MARAPPSGTRSRPRDCSPYPRPQKVRAWQTGTSGDASNGDVEDSQKPGSRW
jgi:hypothetical protein